MAFAQLFFVNPPTFPLAILSTIGIFAVYARLRQKPMNLGHTALLSNSRIMTTPASEIQRLPAMKSVRALPK